MISKALLQEIMWESVNETFETMISLPLEKLAQQNEDPESSTSLVASITFTGPWQGAFFMRCSAEGAEQIAKAMLMIEGDEPLAEAEICDAFGELVNMILGGLKSRIHDSVGEIDISIPSVTKGRLMRPLLGKDTIESRFAARCNGHTLTLAIAYKVAN